MIAVALAALLAAGVLLPQSGVDAGDGLRQRDAIRLAADDLRVRLRAVDQRALAVQNPHRDEGSGNGADVEAAPELAGRLAAAGVRIVLGPLRANVAEALIPALRARGLVALSASALAPDPPHPVLFRLVPSERTRAAAAAARMRTAFGPRACVIDDGTAEARLRSDAFVAAGGLAQRASLRSPDRDALAACVAGADGVYFAAAATEPLFCAAQTARRAAPHTLIAAMSHRGFAPEAFAKAGTLFRVVAAPITRSAQLENLRRRYHARAGVAADDDALRAYAATQIAVRTLQLLSGQRGAAEILRRERFATAIGPIRFDGRGDPVGPKIEIRRLTP